MRPLGEVREPHWPAEMLKDYWEEGRHPAGLNFGDCFTYALAERTGHPVLCAGNDFAATDITVVRPRPTAAEG